MLLPQLEAAISCRPALPAGWVIGDGTRPIDQHIRKPLQFAAISKIHQLIHVSNHPERTREHNSGEIMRENASEHSLAVDFNHVVGKQ